MILSEPPRTQYDWNFSLAGVSVRVHPLFWIMSLLMGLNAKDPKLVMLWVGVSFVSILVHEFGHVLAMRFYGYSSRVVLHGFGGLAIPETRGRWSLLENIWISFAGPLAGFIFALTLIYGLRFSGHLVLLHYYPPIDLFFEINGIRSQLANAACQDFLYVNIYWGLMNLLPIWPLDGGQISRALFEMANPGTGITNSLRLSTLVAGGIAIWALMFSNDQFLGIFFGYMAYTSYQTLESFGRWGGR